MWGTNSFFSHGSDFCGPEYAVFDVDMPDVLSEFGAKFASTTPLNAKHNKVFTPEDIANFTQTQAPQPVRWCFFFERSLIH